MKGPKSTKPICGRKKKQSINHLHQHLADSHLFLSTLDPLCVFSPSEPMPRFIFITECLTVQQSGVWVFVKVIQMSSPSNRGWRKRPAVPRMHTRTKTHKKILSITMATYFQSSCTCERITEKTFSMMWSQFPWQQNSNWDLKTVV